MLRALPQATLKRPIHFKGIGIHSGKPCDIKLVPSGLSSGIGFYIGEASSRIQASFRLAHGSLLCTELKNENGHTVQTVEHLMAALWGMGITNCDIVATSKELAVMDGSSAQFAEAFKGIRQVQDKSVDIVRVVRRVEVRDEDKQSVAVISPWDYRQEPNAKLACSVQVDSYSNRLPLTHPFHFEYEYSEESREAFLSDVSRARTFGFVEDEKWLRSQGLAMGASVENCVVFKGDGTSSTVDGMPLRYKDEWVRHKLLDCLGDLATATTPYGLLDGQFEFVRPGHSTTNLLLRELFSSTDNYEIVRATNT